MFLSRKLAVAFLTLTAAFAAHAADTPAFSVLVNDPAGKPIMFQSTAALKKGDVISIRSFNALPVMVLQIAMCDRDCPQMHLVKTMSLMSYYVGSASVNRQFVVPEDGRVSFWVQRIDGVALVPMHGPSGTFSLQFVNRFFSYATPELFPGSAPLPVNTVRLNDNSLLASFYHRTFVNVSLADAGT